MIGDGSNDSLAIREADLGISFTSADASFASPFSSKSPSIKCVKQILLEGKNMYLICCEVMLYQAVNTMVRFAMLEIASMNYSWVTDYQFTYVSYIFGATVNQFLMLFTRPVKTLSEKFLKIDLRVFGIRGLSSSFGRIILCWIGLFIIYAALQKDDGYIETKSTGSDDDLVDSCQENTALFVGFCIFSISNCFIVYQSDPIKEKFYKNYVLVLNNLIQFVIDSVLIFSNKTVFKKLDLVYLDSSIRGKIAIISYSIIVAMLIFESVIVRKYIQKIYDTCYKNQR